MRTTTPTTADHGRADAPSVPRWCSTPVVPIAEVAFRQRACVRGRVRSVRVRPWGEVAALELVLVDPTGGVTVAFLGRRRLGGVVPGAVLTVEGMVGVANNKLVIQNPAYELAGPDATM